MVGLLKISLPEAAGEFQAEAKLFDTRGGSVLLEAADVTAVSRDVRLRHVAGNPAAPVFLLGEPITDKGQAGGGEATQSKGGLD